MTGRATVAFAALALGAGVFVPRCEKPPPPAVVERKESAKATDTKTASVKGPVKRRAERVQTRTLPSGERIVTRTIIATEAAPVIRTSEAQTTEAARSLVAVTPAAPARRFSLALGLENPIAPDARGLRLGLGYRVAGPLWLEVAHTPARGVLSGAYVGLRGEF